MRGITEKRAIELEWYVVCDIMSNEIKKILGLHITANGLWLVGVTDGETRAKEAEYEG